MSDYQGLNLPQLLDLMKDPVTPAPVSWLPQTVGWWIVGAWLAGVIALFAWGAYRHRQRNRYRREALATLQSLSAGGKQATAGQIATVLRRTALAAYPRARVASLYGESWATFLRESSRNDRVVRKAADDLAVAAYRADADASRLLAPARRWIRVHRA